jgi:hypothetical protein
MRRLLAALPALALCAPAHATTYGFQQSSASRPGLEITASITVDGTLADLPTVTDYNPPPYGFGKLEAFDIDLPIIYPTHVSLADFVSRGKSYDGFYYIETGVWHISPSRIDWHDQYDYSDFVIDFAAGTIGVNSDEGFPNCPWTGACVFTGTWAALESGPPTGQVAGDPVPEPTSAALLGAGVLGLVMRRRSRGSSTDAALCAA